jgi:hypothetical protein
VSSTQPASDRITLTRAASAFVALLGIALASYGGYTQYRIASRLAAGACDGCSPWHPLFVVAPLALGIALIAGGSYVLAKTTC